MDQDSLSKLCELLLKSFFFYKSHHFGRSDIALAGFSQFFATLAKKVEGDVHQVSYNFLTN